MPKKATVQYRELKTEGAFEGADLKSMLVDVLRRRRWDENARHRIIGLDQDGSVVILNKVTAPASWDGAVFAGQIIHLESGHEVHAVLQSLEEDASEFVLQSLDVGEKTKVLKGALYFALVGNNVGLIEGQQVKARTLERYLTALLNKAGEIEDEDAIILNPKLFAGDGRELAASSEMTISAAPTRADGGRRPRQASRPREDQEPRVIEREAASERQLEQATVFEVLRVMGWSEAAIESLGDEIPEDGWVEGLFKIFMKQRRKRKHISRATINEVLRNVDPADLNLQGPDGREKDGVVRLSVQRDVQTAGGGSLLDPESAMEQIVAALRDWAAAGKIDCRFDA